jgi:hypothetical protein
MKEALSIGVDKTVSRHSSLQITSVRRDGTREHDDEAVFT